MRDDLRGFKRIAFVAAWGAIGGAVLTVAITGNPLAAIVGVPLGMLSAVAADTAASKSETATPRHHSNPRQFKWRWRIFLVSPLWGGGIGFLAFYLMGQGDVVWGLIGIPIGLVYSLWLSRALLRMHGPGHPKLKDQG